MKFSDGVNEISDYWKDYYKKLGSEVPLNQPGTNPYQLSQSKKFKFVGKLEQRNTFKNRVLTDVTKFVQ